MFEIELIIRIKIDLALHNLQRLICHKTQTTKQLKTASSNTIHLELCAFVSISASTPKDIMREIIILFLVCFYSIKRLWSFTGVWVTAGLLRSPGFFSVFKPISTMLWSFSDFQIFKFFSPNLWGLFQAH